MAFRYIHGLFPTVQVRQLHFEYFQWKMIYGKDERKAMNGNKFSRKDNGIEWWKYLN